MLTENKNFHNRPQGSSSRRKEIKNGKSVKPHPNSEKSAKENLFSYFSHRISFHGSKKSNLWSNEKIVISSPH
jgi:hypothetical protein